MSVLKLFSENPKDGVTTFDKVRFYEATDGSGTGSSLLTTVAIDTTNLNPIDQGFTSYIHPTGATNKYYASSWYNSVNLSETDKSAWVLGGLDRWDTMFMDELQDTTSAVWTATDRGYFKEKALEALYPDFFYESINSSLTVANDSTSVNKTYSVPFGFFYLAEVGVGDPDSSTQPFNVVHPNNWKFEQNKLVFTSMAGLTDDYPIRLVGSKKYMEVGEVPRRLDPLVMYHLRMSAYLKMADDFPRFLKWSQLQKGTKVSFENLRVHAQNYERMFNVEKEKAKSLMHAGGI